MIKIGSIEVNGKFALAPMAGFTDVGFRKVCSDLGAAYTVTEMVSAKALCYGDQKTPSLLKLYPNEGPVAAQVFGSEPDFMGKGAKIALEISGAQMIDINMGCPVGKIVNNGEGSALMKDLPRAFDVISAVCEAVDVPVTVKFRKGWDKGNVNAVEFAQNAEKAGAAAVAVHGRTRVQMYTGVADWDIIRDVKKAINIPVIANGDVFEPEDGKRILEYTGADMAMIGRGAFGNPFLFNRCNIFLQTGEIEELPPLKKRIDVALEQFELSCALKGERVTCLESRKQFGWYLKGVPHSGYFRKEIVKIETIEDIRRIAEGIKRELR